MTDQPHAPQCGALVQPGQLGNLGVLVDLAVLGEVACQADSGGLAMAVSSVSVIFQLTVKRTVRRLAFKPRMCSTRS